MTLTRIDRVIQAMTQPAIAQAKRSHLLASLENSEGMRSYEGDDAGVSLGADQACAYSAFANAIAFLKE